VAGYQQMILDSTAADIVYTPFFSGVHGNYLKKSVAAAGLEPDRLPAGDKAAMSFASDRPARVWKDIWGAGQGVGNIDEVLPTRALVARLQREYAAARAALAAKDAIGAEAA
jgi:nitronate monooxygenase